MESKFNFIEKASGKSFFAQRIIQTDGSLAYAISWVEDNQFKVELYSINEVELNLKHESWQITE